MAKQRKKSYPAPNTVLLAEVAAEFKVVKWKGGPCQYFGKYGKIDLRKLTLKQAKKLVDSGFPKILQKQKN